MKETGWSVLGPVKMRPRLRGELGAGPGHAPLWAEQASDAAADTIQPRLGAYLPGIVENSRTVIGAGC